MSTVLIKSADLGIPDGQVQVVELDCCLGNQIAGVVTSVKAAL
jgi:hypothetical protein